MDADKKYNWTEFTGFFRIDVDQSKTSRNLVNPVNPVYCFLVLLLSAFICVHLRFQYRHE